jgi:hypothetical protein
VRGTVFTQGFAAGTNRNTAISTTIASASAYCTLDDTVMVGDASVTEITPDDDGFQVTVRFNRRPMTLQERAQQPPRPAPPPTLDQRMTALEARVAALEGGSGVGNPR